MKVKSPVASRRLDLSLCLQPSLGQNALAEPAMDAPTMDNAPCIAWQHLLHRYSTADRAQAEHASIPGFADGLCAKRCPVCVAGATCRHTLTSSYTNFPCKKIIGPGVAIEAQLVHFMCRLQHPVTSAQPAAQRKEAPTSSAVPLRISHPQTQKETLNVQHWDPWHDT